MNPLRLLAAKPWIWSYLAVLIVWVITVLFTGGASSAGLSQAALTFAAFSVVVGIGQMFVITLGPGNIDLSVPATMTLLGRANWWAPRFLRRVSDRFSITH